MPDHHCVGQPAEPVLHESNPHAHLPKGLPARGNTILTVHLLLCVRAECYQSYMQNQARAVSFSYQYGVRSTYFVHTYVVVRACKKCVTHLPYHLTGPATPHKLAKLRPKAFAAPSFTVITIPARPLVPWLTHHHGSPYTSC
jgi:hypothetical protein